jgi:hypothetical protein
MKKINIGYIAANSGTVRNAFQRSVDSIFEEVGRNTGNLAFWYATSQLFDGEIHYLGWSTKKEELPVEIDILVIPAANWLHERSDLSSLADLVADFDKPCIIVGLGAQSDSEDVIPILPDGTVQFLKEVSKRTPSLFLRGSFSQKVCRHYGITNTTVAGCPTILINSDRTLGEHLENKFENPIEKLSVHTSTLKKPLAITESILLKHLETYHGMYNVQDPVPFMKLIINEVLDDKDVNYINAYKSFASPESTFDEFTSFIKKQGVFFCDINSWIHQMRTYSHSLGIRIHGTILSLSAGTPSICITHDTRTVELSRRLKIPNIHYTQFEQINSSLQELFVSSKFRADEFESNRSEIAQLYRDLFGEVKLPLTKHLQNF